MNIISISDLDQSLASTSPPALLDVRLEDDFAAAHLPGALNACVFKTSFLADVAKLGWPKNRSIVVYGERSGSHESRVAADRLARDGYTRVVDFRDGLQGWQTAGHAIEGTGKTSAHGPLNGTFAIDRDESRVEWTGRNLLNRHHGAVGLKTGHLTFENGWLVGGDFTLNMGTITCADITDPTLNQMLISHLKSEDFFDVGNHPEARFQIQKVEPVPGASPGMPNLHIVGELNLRGSAKPLEFQAAAGRTSEGRPAVQAVFALDRTTWGSIYGSGKFFHRLGMHLVNDLIEIQVRLLA